MWVEVVDGDGRELGEKRFGNFFFFFFFCRSFLLNLFTEITAAVASSAELQIRFIIMWYRIAEERRRRRQWRVASVAEATRRSRRLRSRNPRYRNNISICRLYSMSYEISATTRRINRSGLRYWVVAEIKKKKKASRFVPILVILVTYLLCVSGVTANETKTGGRRKKTGDTLRCYSRIKSTLYTITFPSDTMLGS